MKSAYEINESMNLAYHSLWQNVRKLSGGNQQKIVIAKWMLRRTEIFLLDEPTRGIDIGAKFEIYNHIHELTKQKKGCHSGFSRNGRADWTVQSCLCHV